MITISVQTGHVGGKLTRLNTEKTMPLMTKAPAESPNVTASVATVRGTRMKKAAVLKTSEAPKAAAPRSTANSGPACAMPHHEGAMLSNPCSSLGGTDGGRVRFAQHVLAHRCMQRAEPPSTGMLSCQATNFTVLSTFTAHHQKRAVRDSGNNAPT